MLWDRPICSWLEVTSQIATSAVKQTTPFGHWRKVIAAVPQESILGPLSFNIFLNSIFFFLKDINLGNYTHKSTLYVYNKIWETVICDLRQEFSLLTNWFCDNYMVLNPGKLHFMLIFAKENYQFYLTCNDITIKRSSLKKF